MYAGDYCSQHAGNPKHWRHWSYSGHSVDAGCALEDLVSPSKHLGTHAKWFFFKRKDRVSETQKSEKVTVGNRYMSRIRSVLSCLTRSFLLCRWKRRRHRGTVGDDQIRNIPHLFRELCRRNSHREGVTYLHHNLSVLSTLKKFLVWFWWSSDLYWCEKETDILWWEVYECPTQWKSPDLGRRDELPLTPLPPKIFKNKVPKNHTKLSPQKITPKIITQNARFAFFTKIICPKFHYEPKQTHFQFFVSSQLQNYISLSLSLN